MRRAPANRWATLALVISLLGGVSASSAMTPEEEATSTRLMKEGIAARDRNDLEAAERSFQAAHAIANLPSSGLALAGVLERRGKLLAAMAVARGVARLTPVATWSTTSVEAYRQIGPLMASLERRMAGITLTIAGATDANVRVEVDGEALRAPVLGVPRQVDPGRHVIVVRGEGFAPARLEVALGEGEQRTIPIVLTPAAPGPSSPAPASEPPPSSESSESSESTEAGLGTTGVIGLVTLGVGVATALAGIAPAVASESQVTELEPLCPDDVCPPRYADDLSAAEDLALVANVLFVAGGVLAAAGTTLLVIDLATGSDEGPVEARARVRVGPTFVGIDGTF